jgi:uncharacterized membrane protein
VDAARVCLLALGSFFIVVGIARSVPAAYGPGGRRRVAGLLGDHAALGLDYFVGATILNLILNPTLTAAATTVLTILVRKLLTFSLGLAQAR